LRTVLIDQDRDDAAVEQVRHLVADGDDVQLVPLVRLVNGVDRGLIAERREQPRVLAFLRAHDLSLPRDDAAAGALLVELAGVAVAGVEVVLRAEHVPLILGRGIRGRSPRRTAGTGTLVATSRATTRWRLSGRLCAASTTCGWWRSRGWLRRSTWGRSRIPRSSGSLSLPVRADPAAILDAAVDVARAFHLQLQLEVRCLAALP